MRKFKVFLNFLPNGSPEITFVIFEMSKFDILTFFLFFVNMGRSGSENFKIVLLVQMVAKRFQTFPEFSSQWSSQNYFGDI